MIRCPSCRFTLQAPSRPCPDCGVPAPPCTGRDRPVQVRRNGLALLDRPLPNARPIATLAAGQPVRIRRVLGEFAEVQTPLGHEGFVALACLNMPAWAGMERAPIAAVPEQFQRSTRPWSTSASGALRRLSLRDALMAVPRGLAWLQRSPRRAYTVAAAMTLLALLILTVNHHRRVGVHITAPPAATTAGDNRTAAVVILSPADGAEVTAPVGVTVQPPTGSDQAGLRLAYFVDLDPATVLAAGLPAPLGLPGVTVTAETTLTLDLTPRPHTVWVMPVDRDGLPLSGVAPARARFTVTGAPATVTAPLAYQTFVNGHWRLATLGDRDTAHILPGGAWDDVDPAWSSDGTRLAFASDREGAMRLYVAGAAGEQPVRITDGPGQDRMPVWSPDGRWLLFVSDRGGREQVYMVAAEGGAVRQLTHGPGGGSQPSWAPDGLHFAFVRLVDGLPRVFVGDTLDSAPRPLTPAPNRQVQPAWSPDGRFIAFAGLEDGRWSIYVAEAEGGAVRRISSGSADRRPVWSPDGREIAFVSVRDGQSQIVVVDLERGAVRPLTDRYLPAHNPAWPRR